MCAVCQDPYATVHHEPARNPDGTWAPDAYGRFKCDCGVSWFNDRDGRGYFRTTGYIEPDSERSHAE